MNKFWGFMSALAITYLESRQEETKFKIICSKCGNELIINNSTSLDSGIINIYKRENYSEYDDEIVFECKKCNCNYIGGIS